MRNPDRDNTPTITRREFVMTTLATGFAAAVQPVMAQTQIHTDASGLTAGEIKLAVKDGEIPAYRALPANGKNLPTVLVVQEIFGVHEHIKDLAGASRRRATSPSRPSSTRARATCPRPPTSTRSAPWW